MKTKEIEAMVKCFLENDICWQETKDFAPPEEFKLMVQGRVDTLRRRLEAYEHYRNETSFKFYNIFVSLAKDGSLSFSGKDPSLAKTGIWKDEIDDITWEDLETFKTRIKTTHKKEKLYNEKKFTPYSQKSKKGYY